MELFFRHVRREFLFPRSVFNKVMVSRNLLDCGTHNLRELLLKKTSKHIAEDPTTFGVGFVIRNDFQQVHHVISSIVIHLHEGQSDQQQDYD
jgi:hypothetical protein